MNAKEAEEIAVQFLTAQNIGFNDIIRTSYQSVDGRNVWVVEVRYKLPPDILILLPASAFVIIDDETKESKLFATP
jgi:hypothetical protein